MNRDHIQDSEEEQEAQEKEEKNIYIVQTGDTLWKIAEKYYGDGSYYFRIYEENRDIIGEDMDLILPDMELVIGIGD